MTSSPFWQPKLPDRLDNNDGSKAPKVAGAKGTGESYGEVPVQREELIRQMEHAVRLAYLAFSYAESKAGKRLEDREAYDLIKDEGIPEGAGDRGELAEYRLPAFGSWTRYLREARNVLNEQKYTRRAGRPVGKSIVTGGQIEQLKPDDE
jgi:hypothetical protein